MAAAAAGACALAVPASAQIIATSIPRESLGTGGGAEKKFALHLMASPFAKWTINSYQEEPQGSDNPTVQFASGTDSKSKFIFAGELALAAGSDVTVGVGGWYNTLGETDANVALINLDDDIAFLGAARQKVRVSELHANIFYDSIGVQVGLVRTSTTLRSLLAGSVILVPSTSRIIPVDEDVPATGENAEETSVNNYDAFLVYKTSGSAGDRPWSLSVGAGGYRDTETKSTSFSGFVTGSVALYKGLGIDASYWYVGGKKRTAAQRDLAEALETAISDNLSRFTVGVGYSF
jgi:hypothetical protein